MTFALTDLPSPALAGIAPDGIIDAYLRRGLCAVPDARLSELVAEQIARPKLAPADSFVLHAPLELLARTALLPLVEPRERELARKRILWLGATYAAAGEEIETPPRRAYDRPDDAVEAMVAAVRAGELDDVDGAATWLASAVAPVDLCRALADAFLPSLAAAGHAPIFLYLLPRVAPRSAAAAQMVRGTARELARHPDWNVTWHRHRWRSTNGVIARSCADLVDHLRRPESPGDPGSNFIFPTMSLVDRSGLAAELLDQPTQCLDIGAATHSLLRLAAWSMVQDDPDQAPYGWSHCLTMPQAALGVHGVAGIPESGAEPEDAIAIAATFLLGFRSTLGRVDLDPAWVPALPAATDPFASLVSSPEEAASAVWHAPASLLPDLVARLATRAAVQPDAHLAKYTLACLDATSADPRAGRLYLAAAAYLGAWWATRPPDGDPLMT